MKGQPQLYYSERQRRRFTQAQSALNAIPMGASPDLLFTALQPIVPIAAGMLETADLSEPTNISDSIFHMDDSFVNCLFETINDDPTLPVFLATPEGCFRRETDVLDRAQLDFPLYGIMEKLGLAKPSFHKIKMGRRKAQYLLVFQERGSRYLADTECKLVERLHPEIRQAVARLSLPFSSENSLLAQLVDDASAGYLCVDRNGDVKLINTQAMALLSLAWAPKRASLALATEFCRSILLRHSREPAWNETVVAYQGTLLDVTLAQIPPSQAGAFQYCLVIEKLNGVETTRLPLLNSLTPREAELVAWLVDSDRNAVDLSSNLGIAPGTLRKHIEKIYGKLRVHSRLELRELLKRGD